MARKKGSKNKTKRFKKLEIIDAPIIQGAPGPDVIQTDQSLSDVQTQIIENARKIKATLKVLGHIYESEGYTIDEVLNNFKTEDWIKGAGVLTVEKNGITKEKIIAGNHIRNLFGMASGTMREVSLKWVRSLFI